MDDYARLDHGRVAVANFDTGHGGTFWEPTGGAAAAVAVVWLTGQLRHVGEAGWTFLGDDWGLCTDPAWTFEKKRLEGR
jgi:hypothetical protein